MALPKFEYAVYTFKLPSSGREIKYRPFTVKEHKNLISAIEFKDKDALSNAIQGIVSACTFNELKLSDLEPCDIESLFIHIKARSTGDKILPNYVCRNTLEDGTECGTKIITSINLLDTKVIRPAVTAAVINITPEIGIQLKYPDFNSYFKNVNLFDANKPFDAEGILFDCIDFIFDSERNYKPGIDFTREEATEFFNGFTPENEEQLKEFFENIPTVEYSMKLRCPKCKTEERIVLDGITDFLD